jgi:hypothetical protein
MSTWIVFGLLIYFGYGYRNSRLRGAGAPRPSAAAA